MRRAIAETALVAIIIAVVGGLVLLGVVGSIALKARAKIDITACKADVNLAANSKQLVGVSNCYTKDLGTLKSTVTPPKIDEMNQQIAQALYECRYQFGEAAHSPWQGNFFIKDSVCFVCSTFKTPTTVTTSSLTDWMTKHSLVQGGTYLDYVKLSAAGNDADYLLMDVYDQSTNTAEIGNEFDAGTDYAIIDYSLPGRRLTQFAGKQFTVSDVSVDKTQETNWVFATTLAHLNKACDITFTRYP
jgi:hypothetical protein